jgi:hypothetical protein
MAAGGWISGDRYRSSQRSCSAFGVLLIRDVVAEEVNRSSELLLDGGGQAGTARVAISCRKSEIELSLLNEQSVPFACQIVG